MKDNKGLIYLILSGLFITTSPIFAQNLVKTVDVELLAFLWFVPASMVSTAVVSLYTKTSPIAYFRKNWKEGIILGFANALSVVLWFAAIKAIGATLTTFLLRFMTIFLIILGIIFLKEKLNTLEAIGAAIAIAGALVMNFNASSILLIGTIIAVLAAFAVAVQEIIAKIYVARISPMELTSIRTTFVLPFLLLYALLAGNIGAAAEIQAGSLLLIIAGSTASAVIGFIFWYKAIERMDVSKAAIIRTVDPFIVMVYAFLIFSTAPTQKELIGGALIVAGVILSELKLGKVKDALKLPW